MMMSNVLTEKTWGDEVIEIPLTFNGYKVIKTIGNGSFAVVVEVLKIDTNKIYAAKVITRTTSEDYRHAMYEREIALSQTLSCPYLVKVYEVVRLDKVTCIVMEYCNGGDLVTRMENDPEYIRSHGKDIFTQICLGIAYLHKRGMAHRDIKLENSISTGNGYDVKICDFGTMCDVDDDEATKMNCGTIAYQPPEAMLNQEYCPMKADVWSLGILFHCLMTQLLPYHSDDDNDIIKEATSGCMDFSGLPADISSIMSRCCDPNTTTRATIDELLEMLMFKPVPIRVHCQRRVVTLPPLPIPPKQQYQIMNPTGPLCNLHRKIPRRNRFGCQSTGRIVVPRYRWKV